MHKNNAQNTTKCTTKYYKYININISIINNKLSKSNKNISNNNKCTVCHFKAYHSIISLLHTKRHTTQI